MFITLKQITLLLFVGVWTKVFIPLSKLTYGAYLGGLSIQLLQVASMRSPTYFNDSLLVSNRIFMTDYAKSIGHNNNQCHSNFMIIKKNKIKIFST